MTEDQARAALAAPGGWTVAGELQGWRFRVEVVPGGVNVVASTAGGGEPAVWFVPAQRSG